MHRLILGLPAHRPFVDHKDGDGLNNQRGNIRIATQSQNCMNMTARTPSASSRFRGVTWHARAQKWQAQIGCNHLRYYLGSYDTEESAARAYDAAAIVLFGEFSRLNGV